MSRTFLPYNIWQDGYLSFCDFFGYFCEFLPITGPTGIRRTNYYSAAEDMFFLFRQPQKGCMANARWQGGLNPGVSAQGRTCATGSYQLNLKGYQNLRGFWYF
jgi:hypothetical protein